MFSAARHERFWPLWAGSILLGVAYMTAITACGWVAFDLHHHSTTVGLVVFASFLPSLVIPPIPIESPSLFGKTQPYPLGIPPKSKWMS